ncbi:MAG: RlmE family RNA methyltransferase, partial [Desulfobulbus sp.]|nr:RlmE family RNA methyltransferase [Desulfobulbus sp.]
GQRVLDIGCHPGSWSLYAASVVGEHGLVVGVDLQCTEVAVQKQHAEIHWLCYDVYSVEFVDYLRGNWPGFHVLLSDMAPRTTGNQYADHQQSLRLARRVIELASFFLYDKGTLYCKVFQGEDFPVFVQECKDVFTSVKVVKPKSSRLESREVFVLGQGYRKMTCRD